MGAIVKKIPMSNQTQVTAKVVLINRKDEAAAIKKEFERVIKDHGIPLKAAKAKQAKATKK